MSRGRLRVAAAEEGEEQRRNWNFGHDQARSAKTLELMALLGAVASQCQDFGAGFGHQDGVLELG